MSRRRIDEDELIRRLSRAGNDELDPERILDLVAARAGPPSRRGFRIPRAWPARELRMPRQLWVVAAGATVAVIAVGAQFLVASGRDLTWAGVPPRPTSAPSATSAGGGSPSLTSVPGGTPSTAAAPSGTPDGRPSGSGPSGIGPSGTGPARNGSTGNGSSGRGQTTVTKVPGLTIEVSPLAAGSTGRLPRAGGAADALVLAAGADGATPVHLVPGGSGLGPVQAMGPGLAVESGPYQLSWTDAAGGSGSSGAGSSGRWLTAERGGGSSNAVLRIPVRKARPSSRITLYTGTIGGPGGVRVQVSLGGGGRVDLTASLPACGQDSCADLVTITLDASLGGQGSPDVMIDLTVPGLGARAGLAAAELD